MFRRSDGSVIHLECSFKHFVDIRDVRQPPNDDVHTADDLRYFVGPFLHERLLDRAWEVARKCSLSRRRPVRQWCRGRFGEPGAATVATATTAPAAANGAAKEEASGTDTTDTTNTTDKTDLMQSVSLVKGMIFHPLSSWREAAAAGFGSDPLVNPAIGRGFFSESIEEVGS